MEECVRRKQIPPLPDKVNMGDNSRTEIVVKSEIKLSLSL
jgi:hypothetical protein